MFPDCYLNYMNNFSRAVPENPGPHANPMPEAFPMPSPEMFDEPIQEGEDIPMEENIMGGETMPQDNIPMQTPMQIPIQTPVQTPMAMPMPMPPSTPESPFEVAPGAPVVLSTEYTQGYLRTQIGRRMRVTFLLGTNQIQDREGILEDVGISYIILRETQTNNLTLCDIYSIKFVVIFPTV